MSKFVKSNPNGRLQICVKKPFTKRENVTYEKRYRNIKKESVAKEYLNDKWIKVTFLNGFDFDPEWIRQELEKAASNSNDTNECLQIYNYRTTDEAAIVFVKLSNISVKVFLNNCSFIPHPFNGNQCDISVIPVTEPDTPMNLSEKWIECLKHVLSNRFDSTIKHLNLSNLSSDPVFNKCGMYVTLRRPTIVSAITKLFESIGNIEIVSMDLSSNKLAHLFSWATFFQMFPIQSLDVSKNNLFYNSFIKSIKAAKNLLSLTLENDNGLCGHEMKNWIKFVADITDACPNLQKLNNKNVSYDVTRTNFRLPSSITTISESNSIILSFFNDHSNKIDIDREELSQYYSSESALTMSAFYHDETSNNRRLSEVYLKNNRSLDRLKDENKRLQLIKRGSAQILGFYSELPQLRHISDSLMLDVTVDSDTCKIFSVIGLFVEFIKINNKSKTSNMTLVNNSESHYVYNMRLFNRAFVVVPPGRIIQENWTISNPTDTLFKKYRNQFENLKSALATNNKSLTQNCGMVDSSNHSDSVRNITILTPQQKILQEFILFSGMNLSFSEQCLQETDWNVERAKEVFKAALSRGQIPPEAFQK